MSLVTSMKRKRDNAQAGLPAGERLKRNKLTTNSDIWSSPWGWVGTDVFDASAITNDHLLATYGFLSNSGHAICPNKLRKDFEKKARTSRQASADDDGDVIVISDDDDTSGCNKRQCKKNPNCLNYLGQEKWVDEGSAFKLYCTAARLGNDPRKLGRRSGVPVGLINLGATCYANATLQVWFQDVRFRNGVYRCRTSPELTESKQSDEGVKKQLLSVFHLQSTFAALQGSKNYRYNPTAFIDSLDLRHDIQQDASEFSKLFTSLLDTVFHSQADPELQTLLSDQFQGELVYKRTCPNCNHVKTSNSPFLELDIALENNTSLESQLRATSTTEGWHCPGCDQKHDAIEQTVLRTLPPVLHMSLMRFAWDMSTGDRRKVKHAITFPTSIDMGQFVEVAPDQPSNAHKSDIYDLRAILLHKGASAFHGHYISHVREASTDTWFEFDDDEVTRILPPGTENYNTSTSARATASKKRKARKIMDSDDEIDCIDSPSMLDRAETDDEKQSPSVPGARNVKSKDAYMLVYSRRGEKQPEPETPSAEVLEAIAGINNAYEEKVANYAEKSDQLETNFAVHREKMLDVFKSWNIADSRQPSVVASQRALEEFIARPLEKPEAPQKAKAGSSQASTIGSTVTPEPPVNGSVDQRAEAAMDVDDGPTRVSSPAESEYVDITVEEIVCKHGKLDPSRCNDMKRVEVTAYQKMKELNVRFVPELTLNEVCKTCISDEIPERLYQRQHPRDVKTVESEPYNISAFYWISKDWLKDWKQTKPKMHFPGVPDPSPSEGKFYDDVYCEHAALQANINKRARISPAAYTFLQDLFSGWTSLSSDEPVCELCQASSESKRLQKDEQKRQANQEETALKHMKLNGLNGNTGLLDNVPLVIVPKEFIDSWRKWILRPQIHSRPTHVHTDPYQCEHGLLTLDLNKGDMDDSVRAVLKTDWAQLEKLYSVGPMVVYTRRTDDGKTSFVCKPPVCDKCRVARKLAYDVARVTVRLLADSDPVPTPGVVATSDLVVASDGQTKLTTYTGSARQSKRLRQPGRRVERKMEISKDMAVKDLKLAIQEEFKISTICQRLFYEGVELNDNKATASELGILSDSTLELIEVVEDDSILDVDVSMTNGQREEGPAFNGTLLGGGGGVREEVPADSTEKTETVRDAEEDDSATLANTASERAPSTPVAMAESGEELSLSCPHCTSFNQPTAIICFMCDQTM